MSGSPIDRSENCAVYKSDLRNSRFSELKAEYEAEYGHTVPRPPSYSVLVSVKDIAQILDHVFKAYTELFGEKIYPVELKALIIEECYLGYEERILALREQSKE